MLKYTRSDANWLEHVNDVANHSHPTFWTTVYRWDRGISAILVLPGMTHPAECNIELVRTLTNPILTSTQGWQLLPTCGFNHG